ncbi:MAG: 16S rRNA (adenine(1518)-N(6)/adenine(1519)-N(6))-dimethyltransferase RsmA [Burkholderiaceae bacterium]
MTDAANLQHRARKRFGQNFLHDRRVIERIVDAIEPRRDEAIVEIGPGQAALTRELVRRAGHITAIEIDRDLAGWLRAQFTPAELTLIEADALKLDWAALASRPLRVVGNLPYNISSPLLFRLVECADRVIDQHFMLQKEVVDRMVAPPGSKTYGRLSVMLQVRYRMTKLFDVPRGAFNPPPKVTSSIVRMVPKAANELPEIDLPLFGRVVAAAFNQRRKILRNALGDLAGDGVFSTASVDPLARAETLGVDDFVRLTRAIGDVPPAG